VVEAGPAAGGDHGQLRSREAVEAVEVAERSVEDDDPYSSALQAFAVERVGSDSRDPAGGHGVGRRDRRRRNVADVGIALELGDSVAGDEGLKMPVSTELDAAACVADAFSRSCQTAPRLNEHELKRYCGRSLPCGRTDQ